MQKIDFTKRMAELRTTISVNLRDSVETAASLAKKISNDEKTISDRAIREFVEDHSRALSVDNYNLTVEFYENKPCRFDFQENLFSFVNLLTHISKPIKNASSVDAFKQTCQIEYERTYEEDKIRRLERFIGFLREDIISNLPEEYGLTPKQDQTIRKYLNKTQSDKISFSHLVANSYLHEDGFEHGREIGSFDTLYKAITESVFVYGNILPSYLLKNDSPQVALIIGTETIDPNSLHTPTECERIGLCYDQEDRPFLNRTYNKGDFFEPAKRSST